MTGSAAIAEIYPGDIEVIESQHIPEKTMYRMAGRLLVGPITGWRLRHEGRWPLMSRWSLGEIAHRHDKHLRRKGRRR